MPNCRSIAPEAWQHAREALVFYFSRRHGMDNAEDLAQETLAALLGREDFEFAREEDFLKICYGFAARISLSGYRRERKHAGAELDPEMSGPDRSFRGLSGAELSLLLSEVLAAVEKRLTPGERETIRSSVHDMTDAPPSGNFRVRLFRARQKLTRATGWKKSV